MAGRPVGRGGGLTTLHYGLIAFVILTVLMLAGFIFALTNANRIQEDLTRANQRLNSFGSPPSYYAEEATNRGGSVFAAMQEDLNTLSTLIAGRETARPALVESADKLRTALAGRYPGVVTPGQSLLDALTKLDQALATQQQQNASLGEELQNLQTEHEKLAGGVKAAQDEFNAQVAALNQRVEQLSAEREQALEAKDRQLGEIQTEATARNEESQRWRVEQQQRDRERELLVGRLRSQIDDLQKKIQEIKPTGFDPQAILTKADARVIRAIPGSDVVYINIGSNERIRPGLGFEVYSPTGQTRDDLRGKASLEVSTVMETTAECRVTRTLPGQPIVEGDLVVNIAYERNRKPKFVVRGDFDLNYDGRVDPEGLETVTAIIREWGGQVVQDLDETTDFVVIGVLPDQPEMPQGRPLTPVVAAQGEKIAVEQSRFRDLIDQARALYIPVITQSQFLFLTGYSGQLASLR